MSGKPGYDVRLLAFAASFHQLRAPGLSGVAAAAGSAPLPSMVPSPIMPESTTLTADIIASGLPGSSGPVPVTAGALWQRHGEQAEDRPGTRGFWSVL